MHRTTHIEPMRLRRDANVDLSQHVLKHALGEVNPAIALDQHIGAKANGAIAQHHAP